MLETVLPKEGKKHVEDSESLREALLKENMFKKVVAEREPGKRIAPHQASDNDCKYQLRLDSGE